MYTTNTPVANEFQKNTLPPHTYTYHETEYRLIDKYAQWIRMLVPFVTLHLCQAVAPTREAGDSTEGGGEKPYRNKCPPHHLDNFFYNKFYRSTPNSIPISLGTNPGSARGQRSFFHQSKLCAPSNQRKHPNRERLQQLGFHFISNMITLQIILTA